MDRQELVASIYDNITTLRRLILTRQAPLYSGKDDMPTHAQASVLLAVSQHEDPNIKRLASCFSMTSSAATQVVNDLVARGWVTRKESSVDRRQVTLALSPTGKRLVTQLIKKRAEHFSEHMSPLSDAELKEFKRLQDKIINHHRSYADLA